MDGSVGEMGGGAGQVSGSSELVVRQVYEEHRDRLVGYFVRRTGDPGLAEDLAHDVMVRLAGAVDRLEPGRPVWPYMRAIANNVLVDHRRYESRWVDCDVREELADEPVPGDELDDTVVLRSLLDAAIGELSDRQRIAVELRCAREWNVAESAEFLGVDARAFRQLLFRARRNLRAALDDAGARLRGLALPVWMGVRLRTRAAGERVREFVQPAAPLGEALAGVAVAATLGVTAVVGMPMAEAEPRQQAPKAMELVRQDAVPSAGLPVVRQDRAVALGARYTAPPRSTSSAEVAPEEAPPPDGGGATVIRTPEAVPNSNGNVAVGDDDEYFVVSNEVEARTGIESVESGGDAIAIYCGNPEGEVVCATKDS